MKISFYISIVFLFLLSNSFIAQNWAEKMQDPAGNFYDIKADFENYWLTHDKSEKGKGYKAFKRWENFVERRVYPTGNLSLLNLTQKNYTEFIMNQPTQTSGGSKIIGSGNMIASVTWTAMGPFGAISGSAGSQLLKAGRIGFVTIDPANSNNLWIGAPAGGLWKSTNGGSSWTTNTDNLAVLGCSDLAIDPTNANVMYLATGDGDAGDTRSIGVLKSTNGGLTWAATGLTSPVTSYFLTRRLIINPSNTQIVLAATNSGIYRTTNGGTNWTQVSTAGCYDLEFKPGDPNTVYAAGTSFRMSTNGGASFTQISSGITTAAGRMSIAVTPNDANYVYVLASDNSTNGFLGLYRSTTSGTAFSLMSSTPNILDNSTTGSGTGGQGWYDLCIAASPLNKNEVVVGGVNVWRSLDGGASWALYGHWTGSGGAPFTHADQHDLEFDASGTLFNTNDGTIYRRTGSTWTEISGAMNISQIYRIGLSSLTANKWITGHQDNGTSIWNGTTYSAKLGGDGMDCFYDRTNDNNVFGEYQNGSLQRSINGGSTWTGAITGLTGTAPWLTVWKQDTQNPSTLYVGYTDLFKSTNLGASWTSLATLPGTTTVTEFAIAPNNNLVIYVLKSSGIYKTINGGASWTTVTGSVPVGSANPEFICIDPTDANNAWVVLSGYSSGNKVYTTVNGGTSWTNYSANLPNIPANCCVYEPGSNDRIYVGMDVGIYYRDNLSPTWTLYNTGLPNAPIADLEISPASPALLHAATYGRGVWVASCISAASAVPSSSFVVTSANTCIGAAISFSDQSSFSPSSWSWGVIPAGATINSSTSQNPVITFPSAGVYTVNFQASNSFGPGSSFSQTIAVSAPPTLIVANSSQTVCGSGVVSFTASGASSYNWSNGGGSAATASFIATSSTFYTVTGTTNGCSGTKIVTVTAAPVATIGISSPDSICIGGALILVANGAGSYTWSSGSNGSFIAVNPTITTVYSLSATTSNNCKLSTTKTIIVSPLPVVFINALSDSLICLNEAIQLNATGADTYSWTPGNLIGNLVTYTPGATTTYSCIGTDINGCSNSAAFTVSVSLCEGVRELAFNKNLYVLYPNPNKGKLTVKSGGASVLPVSVELLDITGKIVFSQALVFANSERTVELNISALATGTYFVKLFSKDEVSAPVKIIKE